MHPGKPPEWQIGHSWADFFAKVGARSHAVSDAHVEAFAQELRRVKKECKFFAWATAQLASAREVVNSQLSGAPAHQGMRQAAPSNAKLLSFLEHEFWSLGPSRRVCRKCGIQARTQASVKLYTQGSGR
eukprot:7232415-Pyramimonas_sp.AAC.1